MVTVERLLSLAANSSPKPLAGESDYHRHWTNQIDTDWSAEETAFAGGLIADRLAFLFIAGYQAAVRRTFGITDLTWNVLAVSEDQSPENPKPGLVEVDGHINGFKTWVASSRHAENLIVSVGQIPDAKLYSVNWATSGLLLGHKPAPSFLGDMSQGIAEFQNVAVKDLKPVDPIDLKLFAKREPLYLYFAFCGFLQQRLRHEAVNLLLYDLLAIAGGDFTDPEHKVLFAEVDDRIAQIFNELDPVLFQGNFDADKGLMSLYSKVIQKRAGRG